MDTPGTGARLQDVRALVLRSMFVQCAGGDARLDSQAVDRCCSEGMPRVVSRRFLVVALALLVVGLPLVLRLSNNDCARQLRAAQVHADRAERAAAVAACQEAARLCPGRPQPYLELARVYSSWGKQAQALEAVREAERLGADAADVEWQRLTISVRRAEIATREKLGHWEAAVRHGEQLLGFEVDEREVLTLLARAYLGLREWEAAEGVYEQVLVSDPGNETASLGLGLLRLEEDYLAASRGSLSGTDLGQHLVEAFDDAIAKGGPAHAHAVVGRTLLEHQEWALAACHLEQATRIRSDYADAHAYVGHALDRMGYRREAASHLIRATRLEPDSVVAHAFLGLHYSRWGDTAAARAEYEFAYDLAPNSPGLCVEIGKTWAAEGRYTAAEIWLREAVSLELRDPALWEALARFYLVHNVTSENRAAEAAQRLLDLSPDSAEAHHLRGWAALQTGDYEAAESHLGHAIELDPALAEAHYHLGLVLKVTDREDAAESAFERAIDADTTGTLSAEVGRSR